MDILGIDIEDRWIADEIDSICRLRGYISIGIIDMFPRLIEEVNRVTMVVNIDEEKIKKEITSWIHYVIDQETKEISNEAINKDN